SCPAQAGHPVAAGFAPSPIQGLLDHPPLRMMTAQRTGSVMSDIAQLEHKLLAEIDTAADEAALEAVRVAALGKSGSVTALLKTLGALSPDERKAQGAAINGVKERVGGALAARRDALKAAALDARLATETVDVTLPVREAPAESGRVHP